VVIVGDASSFVLSGRGVGLVGVVVEHHAVT
jgi:hypothetical protein